MGATGKLGDDVEGSTAGLVAADVQLQVGGEVMLSEVGAEVATLPIGAMVDTTGLVGAGVDPRIGIDVVGADVASEAVTVGADVGTGVGDIQIPNMTPAKSSSPSKIPVVSPEKITLP